MRREEVRDADTRAQSLVAQPFYSAFCNTRRSSISNHCQGCIIQKKCFIAHFLLFNPLVLSEQLPVMIFLFFRIKD